MGSGSSPSLHCKRILSKQGMECTPVFHNLFPHSSPLHVYKQDAEEEEKRGSERVGARGGEAHRSPEDMSEQGSLEKQRKGTVFLCLINKLAVKDMRKWRWLKSEKG